MSFSNAEMPYLIPLSTQPASSSSMLALDLLDVISMTPHVMSLLNVRPSDNSAPSSNKSSHPSEPRSKLLEALWHQQAGLFVSPNVSYIPRRVPQDTEESRGPQKYSQPGLLRDDELYLAFQPRFAQNEGALFGRLNLTREALKENICDLGNGKYVLLDIIIVRWTRLENALLDVANILLSAKHDLRLTYPYLPWQCGYRDVHASRDVTLRCAVRARDAFIELSAVVSFALSVHMDGSGQLYNAFMLVRQRSIHKPVRAWFDLLAESYICNFSPNFRVGGFINPYTSVCVGYIPKFVQANVPIWVFWGHFHKITYPVDATAFKYSPPDNVIEGAKARAGVTSTLVLPIYRYDPFSMSHGLPLSATADASGDDFMGANDPSWEMTPLPQIESVLDDSAPLASPPLTVLHDAESEAARKAEALVALEDYFVALERVRELCIEAEQPREKQQRESWEEYANTHYTFTKTCKVYEWRELPDGTYERIKINSTQFDTVWSNYTRNQRRFVGHENTWELCPQLPRYSEKHPKEDEPWTDARSDYYSEDETDDEDNAPAAPENSLKLPEMYKTSATETVYIDDLYALGTGDKPTSNELDKAHDEKFNFADFVKQRFGYNIFSPAGWNQKFGASSKTKTSKDITINNAKMALSFNEIPGGDDVNDAVINLVKMLSNTMWTFLDLPSAFDHSSERGLSLISDTLQFSVVSAEDSIQYVIFKKGYIDKCPWGIYTSDASTVLLIFRMKWRTMDVIARELVARGVPFHTVLAAEAAPKIAPPTPMRGLGERPANYQPAKEDYMEYIRRRDELLKGSKGRAALMRGGIVARIARDVLDHHVVLDGPSSDAVTVGKHQRFNLYDDDLTDNDLDIICGVYYVDVESPPIVKVDLLSSEDYASGTKAHMSFWPKDVTWNAMSTFLRMEWSEKAEAFYQKRLGILQKDLDFKTASGWRQILRVRNTMTKQIEAGAQHYQAGYIEYHHRQSRFIGRNR